MCHQIKNINKKTEGTKEKHMEIPDLKVQLK